MLNNKALWKYINFKNVVLGFLICGFGFLIHYSLFLRELNELISGALIGAGVAIILAEITFVSDRREADKDKQKLLERIDYLESLESSILEPQLNKESQLFSLGTSLGLLPTYNNIKDDLIKNAQILGIRDVVEQYANQPNLLEPQTLSIFSEISNRIRERYFRRCHNAFQTGYALIVYILDTSQNDIFQTLRNGIIRLDLPRNVKNYILNSLQSYKEEKCTRGSMILFTSLLGIYIQRLTLEYDTNLVTFFEERQPSINEEATVQIMKEMLQNVRGGVNMS
jgi:hypothetical protein